jgi:hypothetical protein
MKRKKLEFNNEAEHKYNAMLNILVESFMYEPANYVTSEELEPCTSKNIYIVKPYPTSLHSYNREFGRNDPQIIIDDVDCSKDLGCCIGTGDNKHPFLLSEGGGPCVGCKEVVCCVCSIDLEIKNINKDCEKNLYCIGCYSEAKSFPTQREYINNLTEFETSNKDMVIALQSL